MAYVIAGSQSCNVLTVFEKPKEKNNQRPCSHKAGRDPETYEAEWQESCYCSYEIFWVADGLQKGNSILPGKPRIVGRWPFQAPNGRKPHSNSHAVEGSLSGCVLYELRYSSLIGGGVYTTSHCQNSWRKASFQCILTRGTFRFRLEFHSIECPLIPGTF